jgi:hypothetical protein
VTPAAETPPAQPPGTAPAGGGDPVLGALIPQTIAGQPVEVAHLTAQQMIDGFGLEEDAPLFAILGAIGRGPADVNIVIATVEVDGQLHHISGTRAPGVPLEPLLAASIEAARREMGFDIADAPIVVNRETVGGKQVAVVQVQDAFPEDERSYIYGVGDAVIQVSVPPHVAEQIFAELP